MMRILRRCWYGPLGLVSAVSLMGIGVASLVQSNTVAFFSETVNEGSNTFSSQQITFTVTPNGGSACAAGPGTTNNPQGTCAALVTLSNIVAGDSKFGRITLNNANAANEAAVTEWLTTTATSSSALDTTGLSSGGLGMFLFRCYKDSATSPANPMTTVADCGTAPGAGNALYLLPVYPTASTNPCGALSGANAVDWDGTSRATLKMGTNVAVDATKFSTSTTASNTTLTVSGSSSVSCTALNNAVASNVAIGGPSAVSGIGYTASAQSQGLASNTSDYLAAVVYLPTSAGDALQGLSSTLQFAWKGEQHVGASN